MVMKSNGYIEMDAKKVTQDFLKGSLPIVEYRRLFDEGQELEAFPLKLTLPLKPKLLYDFNGMIYQRISAPY